VIDLLLRAAMAPVLFVLWLACKLGWGDAR